MGRVTIKFWDKGWDSYFTCATASFNGFCINQSCTVFNAEGNEMKDVEPHFYKDGERIA